MAEQIRHILDKGKSLYCDLKDRQEMLSLFHRVEKEFEVKENLMEDLFSEEVTSFHQPDFRAIFSTLWSKIEQKGDKTKTNIRYINGILKIAAAVLLGLVLGVSAMYIKSIVNEPDYYTVLSPNGSISETVLPDGTIIFLNAGSQIRYGMKGYKGKREVFLNGEAWFDVKKNKNKPFVVHTPYYDVNVTGTQFNVKAYETDKDATTTLEEGQIIIKANEKCRLAQNIIMKPGEQVVMNKYSKELIIRKVNTRWYTSWKDNKLIFVNMNLKDLVVLLERKYGVSIEVKSKEILDLHFDGTIKNESIIEFLEIVRRTLPVNYKIVGQKIEITANKN